MKTILGNISIDNFLKNYWLKRPLLIKNAVSALEIESFATRDDFIEMSMDEDFESRIVFEKGGDYPWQVKHGPLTESDFNSNKKTLWTLLCHNLNLYSPEFYQLQQMVNFIPDWQFDDIMATVSNKGASVGAHIDNYSVFIVQGQGQRKWSLQTEPNTTWQENLDIKLLKHFKPDIEWVLNPGDAIYIPPHCAHHGISQSDSISYSIGFKSLEYNKIVDFWATQVFSELTDNDFYRDPGLTLRTDKHEILDHEFDVIYHEVIKKMDKRSLKLAVARLLSRPRMPIEVADEISKDELLAKLQQGMILKQDQFTKFNCFHSEGKVQFFINTHHYELTNKDYLDLKKLLSGAVYTKLACAKEDFTNNYSDEVIEIILTMIERGDIYLDHED